jgi:hypothetical protein
LGGIDSQEPAPAAGVLVRSVAGLQSVAANSRRYPDAPSCSNSGNSTLHRRPDSNSATRPGSTTGTPHPLPRPTAAPIDAQKSSVN